MKAFKVGRSSKRLLSTKVSQYASDGGDIGAIEVQSTVKRLLSAHGKHRGKQDGAFGKQP